jgi:hypothetical protein
MGDITSRSYNDKNIHMDFRTYSDNEMKEQVMMANINIEIKKRKFTSLEQEETIADAKKTSDMQKNSDIITGLEKILSDTLKNVDRENTGIDWNDETQN